MEPNDEGHKLQSATNFPLTDDFERIERVIGSLDTSSETRALLLEGMTNVLSYLQYGFDANVRKSAESSCWLHARRSALAPHPVVESDRGQGSNATPQVCTSCRDVFLFFERVKSLISASGNMDPSAATVLQGSLEEVKFFMGHRVRVINQQMAVEEVAKEMRASCERTGQSDQALVAMDYMEFERPYLQKKTANSSSSRKSVSWHFVMVTYWSIDKSKKGRRPPVAVPNKLYLDHLADKETGNDDEECIISMLEALLIRLKKDLPHVKRIVLQSDNFPYYQNLLLPIVLPLLSYAHGIEISRHILTEPEEGASVFDGHLERAMQVLRQWMDQGNSCFNAFSAVAGLTSSGPRLQCLVEFVEPDWERIVALIETLSKMQDVFETYFEEWKDITFEYTTPVARYKKLLGCGSTESRLTACPPFNLKIFEYSSVGSGLRLKVEPSQSACESISTEPGKDLETEVGADSDQAPLHLLQHMLFSTSAETRDGDTSVSDTIEKKVAAQGGFGVISGVALTTPEQTVRMVRTAR